MAVWISIDAWLPEKPGWYLVWNEWSNAPDVAWFDGKKFPDYSDMQYTYWQEMPKPPPMCEKCDSWDKIGNYCNFFKIGCEKLEERYSCYSKKEQKSCDCSCKSKQEKWIDVSSQLPSIEQYVKVRRVNEDPVTGKIVRLGYEWDKVGIPYRVYCWLDDYKGDSVIFDEWMPAEETEPEFQFVRDSMSTGLGVKFGKKTFWFVSSDFVAGVAKLDVKSLVSWLNDCLSETKQKG